MTFGTKIQLFYSIIVKTLPKKHALANFVLKKFRPAVTQMEK